MNDNRNILSPIFLVLSIIVFSVFILINLILPSIPIVANIILSGSVLLLLLVFLIMKGKWAYVIFIILLGAVLLLNVILYQWPPIQADLTKSKTYSLSDVTTETLKELKNPLNATVYISQEIPSGMNGTTIKRTIKDLMENFNTYGRENFDYEIIEIGDSEEDMEIRKRAIDLGIEPFVGEIRERIKTTTTEIVAGISLTYEDYQESMQINLWEPSMLEYDLVKRVIKMTKQKSLQERLDTVEIPNENDTEEDKQRKRINITVYYTKDYEEKPLINQVMETLEEFKSRVTDNSAETKRKIHIEKKVVKSEREINEAKRNNITFNTNLGVIDGRLTTYNTGVGIAFNYQGKRKSISNVASVANNETLFWKEIEDTLTAVLPKDYRIGIVMKQYDIMQMWSIKNNQIMNQIRSAYDENQVGQFLNTIRQTANIHENPSMRYLIQLSEEFYDMEMVRMEEIDKVSERYEALIVVSTNATLTDWELYHIDQFIMKGNPVAFLVNSVGPDYVSYMPFGERKPFAPTGSKRTHNLYSLLENYGVTVKENVIKGSQGFTTDDGFKYPLWLAVNYYDNTSITKNFNLTTHYGWASSMEADKINKDKVDAIPFLETTDSAKLLMKEGEGTYPLDIMRFIENQTDVPEGTDKDKYNIGYMLEGQFESYFIDKTLPERPKDDDENSDGTEEENSDEGESSVITESDWLRLSPEGKNTKVVVISDRDFVADWMAQYIGRGILNNISLMQNVIDWLIGKDKLIPLRGKSIEPVQLNQELVEKYHVQIMWGNIITIPLNIILIGIIIWLIDKLRRASIRRNFNKKFSNTVEVEEVGEDGDKNSEELNSEEKNE